MHVIVYIAVTVGEKCKEARKIDKTIAGGAARESSKHRGHHEIGECVG